ncbi:MAG: response regulator [SAR324 cluster bacterium]|nr:response regulator [SAR324 cluster bacterium]
MRLLVIDDDEQFLSTVTAFLTQRQHHVQGVASGPAGWGLLESRFSDFEAVLLDIRMPELNGLDLLRRLRKADIQLPVVLVTGNADLPKVTEAVYLGISGLVHKPFLPRQLDEVLEKLERQLSSSATPPPLLRGWPDGATPGPRMPRLGFNRLSRSCRPPRRSGPRNPRRAWCPLPNEAACGP